MVTRQLITYRSFLLLAAVCLCSCSEDSVAPVDLTPPERVEELTASPDGPDIEITWVYSGEQNVHTFIDYVDFPPSNEQEWQAAERFEVTGIDRYDHSAWVEGLDPSTTYYFSVLTRDPAGNMSDRSPTVSARTGPRYLETISTPPSTGGIAVSSSGDVYLTRGEGLLWLPSGFPEVVAIALDHSAMDVAIGPQARVFTLARDAPYLARHSPDGVLQLDWGSRGAHLGELDGPEAISTDSIGRVLVAERSNRRVQLFSPEGVALTAWSMADADGALYEPYEMAIGLGDNLYVLAESPVYGTAILKFDSFGEFVTRWGSAHGQATADEVVGLATTIAVGSFDEFERVFVSVRKASMSFVVAFDSEGRFITKWKTRVTGEDYRNEHVNAIAVTADGRLFLSGYGSGGIDVYEVVP